MNTLKRSIKLLDNRIATNGWAGYDPYDVRGIKLILPLQKNKCTRAVTNVLLGRFPLFFRKVFRVKKEINAKAMALFARGYLNLYKKTEDKQHLDKALFCLKWLMEHPSKGYSGFCWGYPFDWQSRVFIPKNTPSGVVTSVAAHTFLSAYELLKDKKYLEAAKSCCDFIVNDLNVDHVDKDKLCFSYTPVDKFHVHNANLFSASVLLRTYPHAKNKEYKEMGVKAMDFTVSHQNEDGSWYYWAPPDKLIYKIDNMHTGFVLECLNICRRTLKDSFKYENELKKGMTFYTSRLFLDNWAPKFSYTHSYPIDIHSCAQGIITFCELSDFDPKYLPFADKVAQWTVKHMQDKKGFFYYKSHRIHKDKIPYIRWGQAWMMRGLSELIVRGKD